MGNAISPLATAAVSQAPKDLVGPGAGRFWAAKRETEAKYSRTTRPLWALQDMEGTRTGPAFFMTLGLVAKSSRIWSGVSGGGWAKLKLD